MNECSVVNDKSNEPMYVASHLRSQKKYQILFDWKYILENISHSSEADAVNQWVWCEAQNGVNISYF